MVQEMTKEQVRFADTPLLRIGYEQNGEGKPLLLLHGWPDSIRTWDKVVPGLVAGGYRTIAPFLRGCGQTTFHDSATLRSGQVTALVQDAIDLLDALHIERATILGHDWGARAGYALAALFPERVERLVVLSAGYEAGIKPGNDLEPNQAHANWYQWFFHTKQGEEALVWNRRELCRYLWNTWAPGMPITDAEFAETAMAWENSDWFAITLHAYRVRWGAALKDERYESLESRLDKLPKIHIPTILLHGAEDGACLGQLSAMQDESFTGDYHREVLASVGHFPQREQPQAVLDAVLSSKNDR